MKNNNQYSKYNRLQYYRGKQTTSKVKKHFMTPEEFLNIYELFVHMKTKADYVFLINVIKTSKTYRHYKTNSIRFRVIDDILSPNYCPTVESYMVSLDIAAMYPYLNPPVFKYKHNLEPIIEWLYSHTVHASSLNSVAFK